jgi:thiol:disulfide interchange protein
MRFVLLLLICCISAASNAESLGVAEQTSFLAPDQAFGLDVTVLDAHSLQATSNRLHGAHLGSLFVMGALSAIIMGPCVTAPLAGALLYIGQTHDAVLGGVALFLLALGMGAPLLLVVPRQGYLLRRVGR